MSSNLTQPRVKLLAAIAIGLAVALGATFFATDAPVPFVWRSGSSKGEVTEELAKQGGADLSEAAQGAEQAQAPSNGGGLFYSGEDVPESDLARAAPDTPTPITAPSQGASDAAAGAAASEGDNPRPNTTPATVVPTRSPEEEMLGGVARSKSLAGIPQEITGGVSPWVYGQARGYTMLYALQPEAQAVTEANIAALLAARVRKPYIGVLIDGTFGQDFVYLKDIIQRLNVDGRDLTLALYLANGAEQRRWRNTSSKAPFVSTEPESFRRDIRRTELVKSQYSEIAAKARIIFEYNLSINPNATNVAVVMLEDNLDRESFRSMMQLAEDQLGGVATLVRNPCVDCGVIGSDSETFGHAREEHRIGFFAPLSAGDAFSLDGIGFSYPTETDSSAVSPEQLIALLEGAYQKNLRYFGLWRKGWQGTANNQLNVAPKDRIYVPSSSDEMEFEIQALRSGLPREAVDEAGDVSINDGVNDVQ